MINLMPNTNTDLTDIAKQISHLKENIVLIYAFNGTGKTRLSVAYKNVTKEDNGGLNAGVYYNAFSEDLFVWDNDTENDEQNIKLTIKSCSLNQYHGSLSEEAIREKLISYKPKFDFRFIFFDDSEKGIDSIIFFVKDDRLSDNESHIKISRGEERIFVWCFFLALFEVEGWSDQQSTHFFIDDPVSSLDDHNIFVTAAMLFDLILKQYENKKIIITTHHFGLFAIIVDWLKKGENKDKFKHKHQIYILSEKSGNLLLESQRKDVFLYHLRLLQILDKASQEQLYTYHFAMLRQVLENISSFLGVGQFSYVLKEIGIDDTDQVAQIINTLAHQKVYHYQSEIMNSDNRQMFQTIFEKLKDKYNFVLHEANHDR